MGAWWQRRTVRRRGDLVDLAGRVLLLADEADTVRRQLAGLDVQPDECGNLRHDISTDEIAPARVCFYFDDTLGEFPYTGLVCGRERPVSRGAVKAGGFVASVAGRRRGKGSSREAAPYAELAAGIRVLVAESFERIYEANAVDLGLLTTTDFAVIDCLRRDGAVPTAAFTSGRDQVAGEIIRCGGLFQYNLARLQGSIPPPAIGSEPRPLTLVERIIATHIRRGGGTGVPAVRPGDAGFVLADLRFSHEYVTPMASTFWDNFVGTGVPLTDPESVVFFRDHLTLLHEVIDADSVTDGRFALAQQLAARQAEFARRTGARLYGETADDGSEGICHALILERHALPGQVVLGTDSHTCQAGALGCLAVGCGTTAMFNAWFTRDVRVTVPPTVRVEVEGSLPPGTMAKDVALLLLAHPFVRRGDAVGAVIEFAGSAVRGMDVDERATLTNMAAEVGGFSGIVAPDARVVDFLAEHRGMARGQAERLLAGVEGDEHCEYREVVRIDCADLDPMVATPGDPGNGRRARELDGLRIDTAYAGSCTGGKRADMDALAAVLAWGVANGLRAPERLRFFVQCGSRDVARYCEERGYREIFRRAGAVVLPPSCGACINAGPGVSRSAGEVTIASINRNFPGRSGPGQVYLASPLVVAASALAGAITTWPSLRRRMDRSEE
jgi:3-isopropylmalate/(R)-2-methylmalate dehydratase large subunit